ncbi:zinc-binding dehydrogenase [Labrys monachus]|uniref:Alcohol dehydrogenase n=1 Tax=Labrys monachus TaxID=217067 RepID=A0ABU0FB86_9HYPH|nr:zinc-binding dehydrogenase [Labrys monachus]MDQ0391592.1 alcohol dehydrogenase [Labrys monachus]
MSRTFKAWLLRGPGEGLRLEDLPLPDLHPRGVLVRVESATVLSYMGKVIDGSLGYATPPPPFIPGTNAVGRVEAVGSEVSHVTAGELVFLSPHLVDDVPGEAPAQILIGLTAMGAARVDGLPDGALRLQQVWRDGVFAEFAQWPAACVTPLRGLGRVPDDRLIALAKLVVPYGGLLRGGVEPGHTVLVNGATGYYGSAGVMVALAMGAAKVVAIGRDQAGLDRLAETLGPRVVAARVTGEDANADLAAVLAAGGRADVGLDLLGRASSTATTLATLRALKRGGRLVLMGSAAAPLELAFGEMLGNDWEVVGNFMYRRSAPGQLAALAAAGLLDLSLVRIKRFALAQLPEAIAAAAVMRDLDLVAVEGA